jgi:hypothetical protein
VKVAIARCVSTASSKRISGGVDGDHVEAMPFGDEEPMSERTRIIVGGKGRGRHKAQITGIPHSPERPALALTFYGGGIAFVADVVRDVTTPDDLVRATGLVRSYRIGLAEHRGDRFRSLLGLDNDDAQVVGP